MKYGFICLYLILFHHYIVAFSPSQTNWSLIGFTQFHYTNEETSDSLQGFSAKRARFGIDGDIDQNIHANIVIGGIEGPDRRPQLINGFIDITNIAPFSIRVGQFFVPFGLEGPTPIFQLYTIDRSTVVKNLNPFTFFRDQGIQVSGTLNNIHYAIAIMNGTGANEEDDNTEKDILTHISYTPIHSLVLGLSGHIGSFQEFTSNSNISRNRIGFDITHHYNAHTLMAEYMASSENNETATGWYVLSNLDLYEYWSLVSRLERYSPRESNLKSTILTLGINRKLNGYSRFAVNYEFRDIASDPSIGDRLTTQFQVVF